MLHISAILAAALTMLLTPLGCSPAVYKDVEFERSGEYLIAFDANIRISANTTGRTIYLIDGEGANEVNLTLNKDSTPVISPDGTKIATVSRRDGEIGAAGMMVNLYIMNIDGGEVHKIPLSLQYSPEFLCWSDDANKLIIGTRYEGFFSVNISDGEKTSISNGEVAHYTGKLSPDGTKIAYMSGTIIPELSNYVDGKYLNDCRINVMDLASKDTIVVSQSQGLYEWNCESFAWSPDGTIIAFSARYHLSSRIAVLSDIYTVNIDGTDQRKIIDGSKVGSDHVQTEVHSWLSQENRIIFTANTDGSVGTGNTDVYSMNYDGTDIQRLTNTPAINEERLVLSLDNREILCLGVYKKDWSGDLFAISIEGEDKGRVNLTKGLPEITGINSFSVLQVE